MLNVEVRKDRPPRLCRYFNIQYLIFNIQYLFPPLKETHVMTRAGRRVPDEKRTIWQGKYLRLVVRGSWEYVERVNITGIVVIVAVTDDRKIVLVEQYRIPVGRNVIELPAGLVGDVPGEADEPLEAAVRRELLEETGYQAAHVERLFDGVPSPGLSDEAITFFLATGLTKVAPGGGDETEDITIHEVSLDGAAEWLFARQRAGATIDAKIFSPLYVYERRFAVRPS
jgi:ADP-ribose pyrophosphatase